MEAFRIELHSWRKLPEYRPQFGSQPQYAGSKEICERGLDIFQLQHMGDVARALDREHEVVGRFGSPTPENFRPLEAIKGPVDLNRGEHPGGVTKLAFLCQRLRIED